jgi:predicted nucleic acid-binding protein
MILIYCLDHTGPLQLRAANRLATLRSAGDEVAVSDLTRLECRVAPIRAGDTALLATFDAFFSRGDLRRVPLTTAVYDRATLIRAQHGFKTLDAIHLAAAVEHHCDAFLTNDIRLHGFSDIAIEALA